MQVPNSADQPDFDIIQFEAAAQARARELTTEVGRLAVLNSEDESDWLPMRGAQYTVADGVQVALRHETWPGNPKKIAVKVRVTQPPVEMLGHDGQLRRVQLTRFIMHPSLVAKTSPDPVEGLEEYSSEVPVLEELDWEVRMAIAEAGVVDRMSPGYRPGELILAGTSALVECKLPNSPNFRTEHYSALATRDARLAHQAALRHAGQPLEPVAYSIAEHKFLMALLQSIGPATCPPEPLGREFDETWRDPLPTLRDWSPEA